jgi:putative ATP-binding cassette transporter
MSFLQLALREMHGSPRKLVFMSALGGISSAAILAAINTGAQAADEGQRASLWAGVLFVVSLFLFIKTQLYVTTTITAEIEAIIHRLRIQLMDLVRRSELLALESVGRSRVTATITRDTTVLTQASNMLCYTMQAPVLIFFVAMYVAYLSLPAFALSVVIVSLAGTIFHFRTGRVASERAAAAEQERRLFDRLVDFLDGFKEIRLHDARSADLFDDAVEVSRAAANLKIHAQTETFKQIVSAQSYMYLLLGAVVFIAPLFTTSFGGASITKITTALLFVVGACFGLVQAIPVLLNANAAADQLRLTYPSALTRSTCTKLCFDTWTDFPTRPSRLVLWTLACGPGNWSSLREGMVQANRRFCEYWPDCIRQTRAKLRSMEYASMMIIATPIAP